MWNYLYSRCRASSTTTTICNRTCNNPETEPREYSVTKLLFASKQDTYTFIPVYIYSKRRPQISDFRNHFDRLGNIQCDSCWTVQLLKESYMHIVITLTFIIKNVFCLGEMFPISDHRSFSWVSFLCLQLCTRKHMNIDTTQKTLFSREWHVVWIGKEHAQVKRSIQCSTLNLSSVKDVQ